MVFILVLSCLHDVHNVRASAILKVYRHHLLSEPHSIGLREILLTSLDNIANQPDPEIKARMAQIFERAAGVTYREACCPLYELLRKDYELRRIALDTKAYKEFLEDNYHNMTKIAFPNLPLFTDTVIRPLYHHIEVLMMHMCDSFNLQSVFEYVKLAIEMVRSTAFACDQAKLPVFLDYLVNLREHFLLIIAFVHRRLFNNQNYGKHLKPEIKMIPSNIIKEFTSKDIYKKIQTVLKGPLTSENCPLDLFTMLNDLDSSTRIDIIKHINRFRLQASECKSLSCYLDFIDKVHSDLQDTLNTYDPMVYARVNLYLVILSLGCASIEEYNLLEPKYHLFLLDMNRRDVIQTITALKAALNTEACPLSNTTQVMSRPSKDHVQVLVDTQDPKALFTMPGVIKTSGMPTLAWQLAADRQEDTDCKHRFFGLLISMITCDVLNCVGYLDDSHVTVGDLDLLSSITNDEPVAGLLSQSWQRVLKTFRESNIYIHVPCLANTIDTFVDASLAVLIFLQSGMEKYKSCFTAMQEYMKVSIQVMRQHQLWTQTMDMKYRVYLIWQFGL